MSRPHIEMTVAASVSPSGPRNRAREEGWLADSDGGVVAALTHERVRELLTDPRLRATFSGLPAQPGRRQRAVLRVDGAVAAEPRRRRSPALARPAFSHLTPRSVDRLRPFLREAAHRLIDGFAGRGHSDFVAEFADVYPSLGLCELIGVPGEDRDRFRGWANTIGLGFNPMVVASRIAEIDAALTSLLGYTAELAARRRVDPRDDLVTRAGAGRRRGGWSADEIHGAIAGLVFAGHETTRNQLGWTVAVLERPAVWDAAGPASRPSASVTRIGIRLMLRMLPHPPRKPIDHGGEHIPAGTTVFLSIWSADHDPTVFPRPEEIAPAANDTAPHLAFGHGAHHCLGAALARAELQDALLGLTERLEGLRSEPGAVWKAPIGINDPTRCRSFRSARRGARRWTRSGGGRSGDSARHPYASALAVAR
jgi:cytochrome P450